MIHQRYEGAFRALTDAELSCVVEDLCATRPELHDLEDFTSGGELLDYCRTARVSQAEVIMACRSDTRLPAIAAVERLMMRPIDRRSPAEVERERDQSRPRPVAVAPVRANEVLVDSRVIHLSVDKNPKREGTASYKRFSLYKTGLTITEFLKIGGTRGDLQWDQERGYIRITAE